MTAAHTPGHPVKPVDVEINGRRYRIRYYSAGDVLGVFVCDVRMHDKGQPRGAWTWGERRVPKNGPTYRAALAKAAGSKPERCRAKKCGEFDMLRCAYEAGHAGDHCYVVADAQATGSAA